VAVFASGGGTNLQALIDGLNGRANAAANVTLVVSDRADARALARARSAAVRAEVVAVSGEDPARVSADTMALLDDGSIDIVALAGYVKLVPEEVVRAYRGRIVNIHPALLPAFGGKGMYGARVHRAVIAAGCTVTGVTVHYVDEKYDEGRPIIQWPVPVLPDDTAETLAARVLRIEHIVYPMAVEAVARRIGATLPARRDQPDPVAFGWSMQPPSDSDIRRLLQVHQD
jgi:formyltetrahydrofolate-dependent phosphoribosylglycinamide formyltransferase